GGVGRVADVPGQLVGGGERVGEAVDAVVGVAGAVAQGREQGGAHQGHVRPGGGGLGEAEAEVVVGAGRAGGGVGRGLHARAALPRRRDLGGEVEPDLVGHVVAPDARVAAGAVDDLEG